MCTFVIGASTFVRHSDFVIRAFARAKRAIPERRNGPSRVNQFYVAGAEWLTSGNPQNPTCASVPGSAWDRTAHEALPRVSPNAYRTTLSMRPRSLSSLSMLVTIVSVVSINAAMLAALLKAVRTTLTGSMIPALNMSTYSALLAS